MKDLTIDVDYLRDTVTFTAYCDSVVGIWLGQDLLKGYGIYISLTKDDEFRIGINGTGESMYGSDLEAMLEWSFATVFQYVNKKRAGEIILSEINKVMRR